MKKIDDFTYNNKKQELINKLKGMELSLLSICKYDNYKLCKLVNLIILLEDYLLENHKIIEVQTMKEKMFEKIKDYKNLKIENDDEFLFLCGQLAHYYASKSQKIIPNNNLINKYISVKNTTQLIKFLVGDVKQYSYNEMINSRINVILSKVLEYKPVNKNISSNYLLIGLYCENLFYKKIK